MEVGRVVNGYKFESKLGRGSFGEVWKVSKGGNVYALKIASDNEISQGEKTFSETFHFNCPYLVKFINTFKNPSFPGTLFIVMELCTRGDLHSLMEDMKSEGKKSMPVNRIMKMLVQILIGLYELHSHNIFHRDLKLENIFLSSSDDVKIGDFGLVRVLDSSSRKASTLLGTAEYMSPELLSNEMYDNKADVWALGVMMYCLCTFKLPFTHPVKVMIPVIVLKGEYEKIPSTCPKEVCDLIYSMLQVDPTKRPSILQMLESPMVQKYAKQFDLFKHFPEVIKKQIRTPPVPATVVAGASSSLPESVVDFIDAVVLSHPEYTTSDFRRDFEDIMDRKPTLAEVTRFFQGVAAQKAGGGGCSGGGSVLEKKDENDEISNDHDDEGDGGNDNKESISVDKIVSEPAFNKISELSTKGNTYDKKEIDGDNDFLRKRVAHLCKGMKSSPNDVLPSLREFADMTENSISNSMALIDCGMFGQHVAVISSPEKSILRFLLPSIDQDVVNEAFSVVDNVVRHGWQTGEALVKANFFKNLLAILLGWLERVKSPSNYTPVQQIIVRRVVKVFGELEIRYINMTASFMIDSGLAFFLHLLRIHTLSFFQGTSPFHQLSYNLINGCSHFFMWYLGNCFLANPMEKSVTFQKVALSFSGISGVDLLFNFFLKASDPASSAKMKDEGIRCGVILACLHVHTDLPAKYSSVLLPAFKSSLEKSNDPSIRYAIAQRISFFTFTVNNRDLVHKAGIGPCILNNLTNPRSTSLEMQTCSEALVNLTSLESIDARNELINAESFAKLKELLKRISADKTEEVDFSSGVAEKRAVVIEKIFLILANLLIGNVIPLGHAVYAGLHSSLVEYLGGVNDAKRKRAGSVIEQQNAALIALHSFTFHQSKDIQALLKCSLLAKLKAILDGGGCGGGGGGGGEGRESGDRGKANQLLVEQAVCGVLWNVAVKGAQGTDDLQSHGIREKTLGEVEVAKKNKYLAQYEKEGIVTTLSQLARPGTHSSQKTKKFAALIIAQLYRNTRLDSAHQHIIPVLKAMKNGVDIDLSFKAAASIDMLKENSINSTMIGTV